jgi:hypothetical protein
LKDTSENERGNKGLPPLQQFAVTLYWLATGSLFHNVGHLFGIAEPTVCKYVHILVPILDGVLPKKAIIFPKGERLHTVMRGFAEHLPLCAGAIDGCLIPIKQPSGPFGFTFWCYKYFYAILLLAVVDSKGIFTYVSVGHPGSAGDAATFEKSRLKEMLESEEYLPSSAGREIDGQWVRPYLVGDTAFALAPYMMKCYNGDFAQATPQANFNYHLIRSRRHVECAFGRLKGRWRVLHEGHNADPVFMAKVTRVCCALHNILEQVGDADVVEEVTDEDARNQRTGSTADNMGTSIRDKLAYSLFEQALLNYI